MIFVKKIMEIYDVLVRIGIRMNENLYSVERNSHKLPAIEMDFLLGIIISGIMIFLINIFIYINRTSCSLLRTYLAYPVFPIDSE